MAHQQGSLYLHNDAWYLKYRTEEVNAEGERKHKTTRLCEKSDKYDGGWKTDKKTGRRRLWVSAPVKLLRDAFIQTVNNQSRDRRPEQDMSVADFWERYIAYCEEVVHLTGQSRKKPSTVRGYKQIWRQHLKPHFGNITLQQYEPHMGTQFLQSLTSTQGKGTLKHIKALGGSLFKRAVIERRIKVNPWHDVEMPEDAIEPKRTQHYTLEEAENIISALVDHVDAQLVIALSCFLGLRPGEIAALRWEDFDSENVHIRRCVVRGIVGTPKTPESVASLPLIDQVRVPLELWRHNCKNPSEGWLFPSRNDTPIDLHNLVSRVIIPHVNGSGKCVRCDRVPKALKNTRWKSLYAGRRCAATLAVEATNGNYAVAQALLRHKSMTTTLNVYKKQITPDAFKAGMKLLEAAATNGSSKKQV
jgi:integrase